MSKKKGQACEHDAGSPWKHRAVILVVSSCFNFPYGLMPNRIIFDELKLFFKVRPEEVLRRSKVLAFI